MGKSVPSPSIFSATLDLDADGKFFGQIQIPHSRNEAGNGNLLIPIVSIKNGEGPCLLLVGGNHGDEFEGQVALRVLAQSLEASSVSGQVVIVPALNLPAVIGNCRMSPIDGKNMNREFPGNPRGTITEKIASYVNDELVQRADMVLDLHSGGRNYNLVPQTRMHSYPDKEAHRTTLEMMKAFAAPLSLVTDESDREGMLDTAVESLNKPFVCTELGGQAAITPRSIAITTRGVKNTLIHCGLVEGEIDLSDGLSQLMAVPSGAGVYAQDCGIYEPFVDLGDTVEAGQAVGQMHCVHLPGREPLVHRAAMSGMVYSRRSTGLTDHGDFLLGVAIPADTPV